MFRHYLQVLEAVMERMNSDDAPSKCEEPIFSDVDWRLDVILSNQSLGKVLQPEVRKIF